MTKAPDFLVDALPIYNGKITDDIQYKKLRNDHRDKLTHDNWYELLGYVCNNMHVLLTIDENQYKSLDTKIKNLSEYLNKHDIRDWHELEAKLKKQDIKEWYKTTWGLFTSALEIAWLNQDNDKDSLFVFSKFKV